MKREFRQGSFGLLKRSQQYAAKYLDVLAWLPWFASHSRSPLVKSTFDYLGVRLKTLLLTSVFSFLPFAFGIVLIDI
jgi:hypothetical protein